MFIFMTSMFYTDFNTQLAEQEERANNRNSKLTTSFLTLPFHQGGSTVNTSRVSKRFMSVALGALSTIAVAFPLTASANDLSVAADQPTAVGSVDSGSETQKASYQSDVHIVLLEGDPLATYMGDIKGLKATSNRATGANRLDTNSKASKKYRDHLKKKQAKFVADSSGAIGRSVDVAFDYQIVLNGIAAELSENEAEALRNMPGVKAVVRERHEVPLTDNGPDWINAGEVLSGPPNNVPHSMGEGIVIAILDTGINSDHPSFADLGGDGHDHDNPLGSGNYVPGSYCDTMDPGFCNDKLIGAWSFVPGDVNYPVPEDSDGHGSHTAGTAGGNVVNGATLYAPTTSVSRDISGVLPHANIIAYDVCIDTCPGAALLAAVNQVVDDAAVLPDGIHALNYSISGGNDPYNDAVELAFLNATAAGVYVATSAGNDGPGPATTGHNSPWVAATGATTHNRAIVNSVVDMDSDDGPLADIVGAGFTAGYGPETIINSADLEGAFPGSTLCGLGGLGSFIPPWPPGTFNGEIVACTRGTFGRVEKGANALAAGAGGYILMDNGAGIVGDAHVLPGVHISQADGAVLAGWLAANTTTVGTINGFNLDIEDANGDIMAGFSSRGPNSSIDIVKPDIAAPGVSIFAAEANGQAPAPEYQFLSGTSMASPHNAGAGALLAAVRPDWTPYQIKSALMMTATRDTLLKEDGVTPADAFDIGAGRINLERAQEVGVTLNEAPMNFLLADPDLGGDPKTLNIASMQDSGCLPNCSWTRTVTNVENHTIHLDVSTTGPAALGLSASPSHVKVKRGQSADITVSADTSLAPGVNFASLELARRGDGPDLHMPIVAVGVTSSNPDVLSKTVDAATAGEGEPLNWVVSIVNGNLVGQIDMVDVLPDGTSYVPGSATAVVTDGTSNLSVSGNTVNWSGTLAQGALEVNPGAAPFGYVPLSLFVGPVGCPSNCDDGAFIWNVPAFSFNGQTYTQTIMSVNGTLEAGSASGQAASWFAQNLPDPTAPNNLMAPLWTDLDLGLGGNWYVAVLSAGPTQWTVYEWENVPQWGNPGVAYTFQIWVQNTGAGGISYVYNRIDSLGIFGVVGVENETGTLGDSHWYAGTGTPPAVGADLEVVNQAGGTVTISFQGTIDQCDAGEAIVNRADVTTAGSSDAAIAVTECVD